ncbi:MAG: serine protease, partial [Ktedonobacteraceae bacterium]|nr:serine protease [Ktedonobacteraceae bacterium]
MISPAASSSAIRILRADGTVVGMGFLVDARHIFTCAHVVAEALALSPSSPTYPSELIALDFPLLPASPTLRARVVVWQPVKEGREGGDIAGLELLDAAPEGARPAPLAQTMDVWGHDFRTFGFPAITEKGTWSTGRLLAEQGNGWIQIEDNRSGGVPVRQGFSGAAVWDEQLEGVVGMVVATLHDPGAHVGGPAGIRVAFAIPQRLLLTAWSSIQPITRPLVFLSAAQSDTTRRERLQIDLAADGVLVWDGQHGPARTFPEAEHEQQAIRASMALLVITSNATAASLTVREHLRLAELYQRHIIFIKMSSLTPHNQLNLPTDSFPTIFRGADSSRTNLLQGENGSDQTINTTTSLHESPNSTSTTNIPKLANSSSITSTSVQDEDESETERRLAQIARQNLNLAWIDASHSPDNDYQKTVKTIKEMLSERNSSTSILDALTEPVEVPRNPYVGLRAFTARERGDFFGREAFVEQLHADIVRRLDPGRKEKEGQAGRLLMIIGASGSGKSSVMMAGLLPRLQEDAESRGWLYLPRMMPGSRPIDALVDTLSPSFPDASFRRLREDLMGDSTDGLHRLARQLAGREELAEEIRGGRERRSPSRLGMRVVLFVDQFEELFTQTVDGEERRR